MSPPAKLKLLGLRNIDNIPQLKVLSKEEIFDIKTVAHVLPFRTNNYVVEQLIDWNNVPDDPIFILNFMQPGMLSDDQFKRISNALKNNFPKEKIAEVVTGIRNELNPHPAGQMELNVPSMEGHRIPGVQHKYRETCLIFPSSGQTCHAYCTFCFRWPQFIGDNNVKFATDESKKFQDYIKSHKEITNILITGGDPLVMSTANLRQYILPFLSDEFAHIHSIRLGSKALAYWPYRFTTDKDADDLLRLFEAVVSSGKHLSIMAHFNHYKEMETDAVIEAISRIRNAGAEIRTQSPLLQHINDDSDVWYKMWKNQVALGMIPYYMFIERNTGAQNYFSVPLYRAYEIFRGAFTRVSGLSRTVRGPSMSAVPGKVAIEGVSEINDEKVFVLTFLQGRNPEWVKRPFFAKYDEKATWLTELRPAFGDNRFFYQNEMDKIRAGHKNSMFFFSKRKENVLVA